MSILYYFIDEETRKLRPEAAHKVVAQKDHNADVIRVGIPETMNSVDLETSAVRCMYQRPKETEVRSKTAAYYDTSGGYLWYDWTLQEGDTAKAGKINFSVCLQHIEGGLLTVDWNSTIGEIFVKTSYHSDDGDEADETITPTVAQRVAVLEAMIQRVASGAPIVVGSASEMTDTEQIYVLSTDGMWYYHNGSAWVAGGVYGGVPTDTTLIQSGMPADAKTVGDEFTNLKSALTQTAEVENQVVYCSPNASGTYRTLTYSVDHYDVFVNGTSDATIKFKLTDGVSLIASSTYPNGWLKTIPLEQGHKYKLSTKVLSGTQTTDRAIVRVLDSDNTQLISKCIGDSGVFDGNGKNVLIYCYFYSGSGGTNLKFRVTLEDVTEEFALAEQVNANTDAVGRINGETKTVTVALTNGGRYILTQNTVGSAPFRSSGTGKYADIDVSYAYGGSILMTIDSITSNDTVAILKVDKDNKVISKFVTSNSFSLNSVTNKYECKLSVTRATKLCFSIYGGSTSMTVEMIPANASDINSVMYVGTDGNDANDGISAATPKATITAAIKAGAKTVLVKGGKYYQQINLSSAKGIIKIAPAEIDKLPVFYAPNALITETETLVSGTTKVYSCECTQTFDNKNIWIFQDGVPDASTTITTDDRHPLQRGKACRCDDTKIVLCTSTTLADALVEIENASVYKWFVDTENHVLYFSRPQAVTQANPIMASFGGSVFQNITRGIHITMTGIGVKYQKVNLVGMIAPVLTDCFCGNIRGAAAFQWDGTSGARLYRCEAFRVFYASSSGDGFNAHSDKTGDAFAKQTGCFLFDCWAHDCCDDGYSDHERCEITIFGGLFENNGAGVTPAVGSHCTCYNVLSRYNGEADFFYTGNPESAEGGVGGQIACYGCVSKGTGTGRGFRLNGSEVQGLFVDCVVIDRQYGFFSESNGGTQVGTLINCSTVNCTTPKSTIFTAINGVPVT